MRKDKKKYLSNPEKNIRLNNIDAIFTVRITTPRDRLWRPGPLTHPFWLLYCTLLLGGYKEMSSILDNQWRLVYQPQCGGRGGGGELRGPSQWVQLHTGAQINFRYLTPYLTHDYYPADWSIAVASTGRLCRRRCSWCCCWFFACAVDSAAADYFAGAVPGAIIVADASVGAVSIFCCCWCFVSAALVLLLLQVLLLVLLFVLLLVLFSCLGLMLLLMLMLLLVLWRSFSGYVAVAGSGVGW